MTNVDRTGGMAGIDSNFYFCTPLPSHQVKDSTRQVLCARFIKPSLQSDTTLIELTTKLDSKTNFSGHFVRFKGVHYTSDTPRSWASQFNLSFRQDAMHPDWFVIVIIFTLLFFGSIRIASGNFISNLFESLPTFGSWAKFFNQKNPQTERISFFFNLFSILVYSLLCLETSLSYHYGIAGRSIGLMLLSLYGLIALFFIFKFSSLKLIGFVAEEQSVFYKVRHSMFAIHKVVSIIILPLVVAIPYINTVLLHFCVSTSLIFLLVAYLLIVIRTVQIFLHHKVSILYQFLYFCTLEVVPTLMIYKYIVLSNK